MAKQNANGMWKRRVLIGLISLFFIVLTSNLISALPNNVTVTYISNSTKAATNGSMVNYTGAGSTAGGYIFTINVNATTQNTKWKAYVGNVSGALTLDDATGATIFDWTLTSVSGEIYATRAAGTVNWSNVNCSYTNTTEQENWLMNQSNGDDNISKTFNGVSNKAFTVGTVQIYANTCPTTNLYINDSSPTTDQFEEVLLYDKGALWNYAQNMNQTNGTEATFGNVVYAQILEKDVGGYRAGNTYDFQIILAEKGFASWDSATPYYFYVELS